MIILQSHDQFDLIGRFDPSTFHIEKFSKNAQTSVQSFPIQGSFSEVEGRHTYLYRERGLLFFGLDDNLFEVTDDTIAVIERLNKNMNRFNLIQGSNILISVDYYRPKNFPPLGLDPTPFAEEEDYDFLLFVTNVLGDQGRRKRVYGQ